MGDLEMLRETLGIDKWMCFGGSWGSTLSLVYAIKHPERVTDLVMRGIFLMKQEELDFFFQQGTSMIFPDAYQAYSQHIPEAERGSLIQSYYKRRPSTGRPGRCRPPSPSPTSSTLKRATTRSSPPPSHASKRTTL